MNLTEYIIPKSVIAFSLAALLVVGCDGGSSQRVEKTSMSPQKEVKEATSPEVQPLTNMVQIKSGTFLRMKHPVTISRDFWIGRYEVTQAEFSGLMHVNPSQFKDQPNAPVEKVKFYDSVAYCARLTQRERKSGNIPANYSYRLPTEAEWEYACRAGTTNLFSFGDSDDLAETYSWTAENSDEKTHPVGLKKPNPWGLYDIHGNVWEWCLDWYGDYPSEPVTDPTGPEQGETKVFRGGGWNNDAPFARSANRFTMSPSNGIHFVGFRIVLAEIPPDD